jgi:hypothetical protein
MAHQNAVVEKAAALITGGKVKRVPAQVYRVGDHTVVLFTDGSPTTPATPAQCDCLAGRNGTVCSHQTAAAFEFKEGR